MSNETLLNLLRRVRVSVMADLFFGTEKFRAEIAGKRTADATLFVLSRDVFLATTTRGENLER